MIDNEYNNICNYIEANKHDFKNNYSGELLNKILTSVKQMKVTTKTIMVIEEIININVR
jgi:hypothetical protein